MTSPEMIEFAQRFHAALRSGNVNQILSFFTEDARYLLGLLFTVFGLNGFFAPRASC
jgi:hypothetical protein